MFDIRKRKAFQTVGELRTLLNALPADTRISICGDINCFYHEEQDGSLICFDCEDLRNQYNEWLEETLASEPSAERDAHLESLWKELSDVPMDPKTECMEDEFCFFPAGTHRENIWHWFDEHHSKGVAYLHNGTASSSKEKEGALTQFIRQEVPYRLTEILDIPSEQITGEAIQECVETLDNDTSILFDYDRIDKALLDVLKKHGIYKEGAL